MDPISISLAVGALIGTCVKVVRTLKTTIETMRRTRAELAALLEESERMRLLLEQVRCLILQMKTTGDDDLSEVDLVRWEKPIKAVEELCKTLNDQKFKQWEDVVWLFRRNDAVSLLRELRLNEGQINTAVTAIAAKTSLMTLGEIRKMRDNVVTQAQIIDPFQETAQEVARPRSNGSMDRRHGQGSPRPANGNLVIQEARVWYGDTLDSDFDEEYIFSRKSLADAAYWGDWPKLFSVLDHAEVKFGQSWVNCSRLKPSSADPVSGWSPVHQAAYMRAPVWVVEELVQRGAFRTLRTLWTSPTEFGYRDRTSIEIARELGNNHLIDSLAPVIRRTVPGETLQLLQKGFHSIIMRDFADQVQERRLRLPELVVLTELEVPQMWFPLRLSSKNEGYLYRLDDRELVVRCFGSGGEKSYSDYRISEEGVTSIEGAIVFNSVA